MNQSENIPHVSISWSRAQPAVASYINSLIPNFHAAEDVLQSVALIVVKKYDNYDASRPFLGWAIGIARNEVLHYRRTMARDKLVFSEDLINLLAETFENQEDSLLAMRRAFGKCMGMLTQRTKEIFRLRYGESLSVGDVAERLGVLPNAVSAALTRGRRALRDCLSAVLGAGQWC